MITRIFVAQVTFGNVIAIFRVARVAVFTPERDCRHRLPTLLMRDL